MNGLAPRDRPREKLERHGAASLGDNELVAVLLGHGTPAQSVLEVANQVLALAGGVQGLTRMHRQRLASLAGIGPVQAGRLLAAVELGRRTLLASVRTRPRFRDSRELAIYLLP